PGVALAAGDEQIVLVHANFAELAGELDALGIAEVDGVLFDFGVSSMQLDRAERGFSFQTDGPLDMRMNSTGGRTARELLETIDEPELTEILATFGEDRAARRIARAILAARARGALPNRTNELARLVAGAVQRRGTRERIHPATRTFQALRIAVNDELSAIERGLDAACARTRVGGRIVAISFHSLEDRIVKRRFRDDERLRVLTKKPLGAGDAERATNPRARSAKLRAAERVA
ncbi:MAG: 16S rRNA (cytosine(1402)-N(4))-methyltransferase RsmH, partial [Vulcanimicrobiaceae bacterium]